MKKTHITIIFVVLFSIIMFCTAIYFIQKNLFSYSEEKLKSTQELVENFQNNKSIFLNLNNELLQMSSKDYSFNSKGPTSWAVNSNEDSDKLSPEQLSKLIGYIKQLRLESVTKKQGTYIISGANSYRITYASGSVGRCSQDYLYITDFLENSGITIKTPFNNYKDLDEAKKSIQGHYTLYLKLDTYWYIAITC